MTERQRTEAALHAAHATFRNLVDNSPFGIYVVDADFRLVQVSAGAQNVFKNVRPLLERDFADVLRTIWAEPFASEAIGRFRHTLQTGEPYHAPSTVERRRDIGQVESYDWKIERITLPDGRYGVVCHFYDLSERQRYEAVLRESEQRFRTMADTSPVMIWVTDPRGQVEFVNRAYLEFFGVSEQQVRGPGGWQPLVHPDDFTGYVEPYMKAVREGAPFAAECRVRHADGTWRWIASYAAARFSAEGKFLGHVGSSPDITERRRAEQALLDADRRKDEFLATLAHELRNPLAPVMNSIELLDRVGGSEALAVEARGTIRRQMQHLVRLVDDLLDISRITRDKLELRRQRVEVAPVLRLAVEDNRALCAHRRHELCIALPEEPLWVHADATRLAQVVGNLLNNACKYTPSGGRIVLGARCDGADVVISVTDNGIGIAPESLAHVFEIFTQVHSGSDLSQGGLGIGLSLVKRLVEMHGGTVEAHSDGPGRGSRFVVRLPFLAEEMMDEARPAEPALKATADPAALVAETPRRRILVVDDNKDAAVTLARLLRLSGNRTHTAHDGPEALRAAEQFDPDMILLDIGLPQMSGYEVCREIRRKFSGRQPIMIALTGWGQDEDRRQSAEAGFDHHLVKPVDYHKLSSLLDTLLPANGAASVADGCT